MVKLVLSKEQKEEICNIYSSSNKGVTYLAELFHVGKVKIKNVLAEFGIEMKSAGKQGIKNDIKTKEVINNIGGRKKKTTEEFITEAKVVWGDKYDYSNVNYVNAKTKVLIKCNTCGREFEQLPNSHLDGHGCNCQSIFCNDYTTETWIDSAKKIHGDKYNYTKTNYINANTPIIITCNEHGDFTQRPSSHLRGHGCRLCGDKSRKEKEQLNNLKTLNSRFSNFIQSANDIHSHKYTYDSSSYTNTKSLINIICPKHGQFTQDPRNHLRGSGCPVCGKITSKAEDDIYNFCVMLFGQDKVIRHDRTLLDGLELDIFIPNEQIAIEYNGLYWHNEKSKKDKLYHFNKLKLCNEKGVKLIHIFEDEFIDNKELLLEKLKHIFNKATYPKIYARKCYIREIDKVESKEFLEKNHIQGFVSSSIYLGCFYKEKLIGVMTFLKEKDGYWNLNRFASDVYHISCGISGKIFKYFIKKYKPLCVKTFADRRWTLNGENNMYIKIGFKLDKILPPNYTYFIPRVYGYKRIHKFNCRKNKISKKFNLPKNLTEYEMLTYIGASRVWDCGLFRYIWKP